MAEEADEVMNDWPHQTSAVADTLAAIAAGDRRICLTSPTGGGKTRIATALAQHYLDSGRKVVLYTNRKLLVEQTSRVLNKGGLEHGVRAAGYEEDLHRDLQVSSIQTENARSIKGRRWDLHDADLVIVDEAHLQTGKVARRILDEHHDQGAAYVGLTATPIGLADVYDRLVVAGSVSELRRCGALVPCYHYGPDEPDLRHIGRVALGEDLSETQNVKAIMTPTIFARVFEWWQRLNPDQKPTILFAPGVGESIWFAEQFHAAGVSAAHIDGADVWVNGKTVSTSQAARDDVLAASKDGRIKVVCNRFVLREGIDCPWLAHGVMATVFGSLQSYLQSGGRLLRAYPGLDAVTLQDHGGNWWRHGSLNADREWRLEYTANMVSGLRQQGLRDKKPGDPPEPCRCPRCGMILVCHRCPCGWEVKTGQKKSRPVVQTDGTLIEMVGDIFKPRQTATKPDTMKLWKSMYFRARNSGKTFLQAEALFVHENHYWPPRTLPLMPTSEVDWFRKVSDVPSERLR